MAPARHTQPLAIAQRPSTSPYTLMPKTEPIEQTQEPMSGGSNNINKWRAYPPTRRIEPAQQKSTHNETNYSPSVATHTPTSNRRDYVAWSKRETEALVKWLDTHDNFNAMKRNTARMLPMLAEHLQNHITGCTKTAKQCDHKIRNLKKCYKKVKEKLSSSATADAFESASPSIQEDILDQFPYFEEFERIMTDEHIVRHIPKALLKLAADGGTPKSKWGSETTINGPEESGEDDQIVSESVSPLHPHEEEIRHGSSSLKTSFSPSSEQEFPNMSRFRSIRPKDEQPLQCPVSHHQAKSIATPENISSSNNPHSQNKNDLGHITPFLNSQQLASRHSHPELSSNDQPDFKKQRIGSNTGHPGNFFSPYSQIMSLNSTSNMFANAGPDIVSNCPIKMDSIENGPKCPMGMDNSTGVNLFSAHGGQFGTALASLSQISTKNGGTGLPSNSNIASTSSDASTVGIGNTVDENNPHGTLLNILKMMSRNPTNSNSHEPATSRSDEVSNEDYNSTTDESNPQETAQILAEHIKTSLAKKESVNRQKLYLTHLQSQIQRHTMRAEMLYNNGQISRASKVMDKIDELELELHEVLSRPLNQF